MDSDEHPARTQTHFCAQPHDPALPRLRTFDRIPTFQPRHACTLLRPTPRSGFAPSAHLRPHSDPLAAPRLCTFVRISTHEPPHVCAPPSSFLRTFSPTSTYFFTRFYGPVRQIIKRIYTNHLKYSYKSFKRVI